MRNRAANPDTTARNFNPAQVDLMYSEGQALGQCTTTEEKEESAMLVVLRSIVG